MDRQQFEIVTVPGPEVKVEDGLETAECDGWTKDATNYLLELHNAFVDEDGNLSRFKSKKSLWMFIADQMKKNMGISKTYEQCNNRHKTILRRKRRDDTRNSSAAKELETQINVVPDLDLIIGAAKIQRNRPSSTSDSSWNYVDESQADLLTPSNSKRRRDDSEVALLQRLINVVERREKARAQQHEEKMALLRRIADQQTCKCKCKRIKYIASNCDNPTDN